MKKIIIFRADGNSSVGLGHLYRLFSLVEIYKESLDFIFVTQETSTHTVIPKTYSKVFIPKEISIKQEPQWLSENFLPNKHIIVADGYQFNSAYQKEIKDKGYDLVYIDDLTKEHMFADIVINHSPYVKEEHYKREPYTKLALGTQYALLRPLFLDAAKKKRVIKNLNNVFVCFGGADPYNLTLKAVEALIAIEQFKEIHVVLGGAYKHDEIYFLKEQNSQKVKVYKNQSEESLINIMKLCNFAIAPASTILYEICCVKTPVLSGFYVDNQELIYKGFLNENIIYDGGDFSNYESLDFYSIIKNKVLGSDYNTYLSQQEVLFDNKIGVRHINLIKSIC